MPSRPTDGISRRKFLTIAGVASVAVGCSAPAPRQKLVPYVEPPTDGIPGTPLFYRTVCRECPAGCGVTARTREGRAVKLEGSPDDPIGSGAICARGQAAIQGLYAPDRYTGPARRERGGALAAVSWDQAIGAVAAAIGASRERSGAPRVRILTRPEPGGAGILQRAFMDRLGAPAGSRIVTEPHDPAALRHAGEVLFDRAELPAIDLGAVRHVVSFGAEFLETWLSPVEQTRQFAAGRGTFADERRRLTWIAPRLSLTGASADRWLAARAVGDVWVALGLLHWLCDPASAVDGLAAEAPQIFARLAWLDRHEVEARSGIGWEAIAALGSDLAQARPSAVLGPGVSSAGPSGSQLAIAIQLINHLLGNIGRSVLYGLDPLEDRPAPFAALTALVDEMNAGRVDVLFVHHADPVGAFPAPLAFEKALAHVPLIVSFASRPDRTTAHAHLVLPDHHTLESFGDVTPRRGVVQFAQPVMTPYLDTRSASQSLIDVAARLSFPGPALPTEDVAGYFLARVDALAPGASADQRDDLRARGGLRDPAPPASVTLRVPRSDLLRPPVQPAEAGGKALDLLTFPTVLRFDGRSSGTPWLDEVPDPISSVSWVTWAELSPRAAARYGLATGDTVTITTPSGAVDLPLRIFEGLHDDAIAIPLGGAEPLALLPADVDPSSGALIWQGTRATVGVSRARLPLPLLAGTPRPKGREIVRTASDPRAPLERPAPPGRMYPLPEHPDHRWGMAIDLDRCTGCSACAVACYAENNVPVTGIEGALAGRNMGWLRVEHSIDAEANGGPEANLLVMLCQQCSNAPCETVCPTLATFHTAEGLNAQVYNRCVGTRYCSNNCPYKARTFNWFDPVFAAPLDWQLNPDVTVRSKGVMEKCTFCVQRIRAVEGVAEGEGRPPRDGEVVPACAQSCPAEAIVFGDLNDPTSRVSQAARGPRGYGVLEELNTLPAVTYLARVREKG